jgi:apolipoprotein N-acyltransferase
VRGELRTLIIQQNLDPWTEGTEATLEANMSLVRRSLDAGGPRPELVLFSESSLSYPFLDSRSWYERNPKDRPFLPWLRSQGLWLLTGSPVVLDWEKHIATNSVLLIDPSGTAKDDYAKIHPVPFAEAIPFYEYAWFKDFLKRAVGLEGGWAMGSRYTVFTVPSSLGPVDFSAPICFEDAFAPLCRTFALEGADLLVNLTNDSWSRTNSAQYQHLAAARFRSIETRRSLVRSTNSGISGFVDPLGRITVSLDPFVAAEATVLVPIARQVQTTYLAFGEWFATLCLGLTLLWTAMTLAAETRMRRRFQ